MVAVEKASTERWGRREWKGRSAFTDQVCLVVSMIVTCAMVNHSEYDVVFISHHVWLPLAGMILLGTRYLIPHQAQPFIRFNLYVAGITSITACRPVVDHIQDLCVTPSCRQRIHAVDPFSIAILSFKHFCSTKEVRRPGCLTTRHRIAMQPSR